MDTGRWKCLSLYTIGKDQGHRQVNLILLSRCPGHRQVEMVHISLAVQHESWCRQYRPPLVPSQALQLFDRWVMMLACRLHHSTTTRLEQYSRVTILAQVMKGEETFSCVHTGFLIMLPSPISFTPPSFMLFLPIFLTYPLAFHLGQRKQCCHRNQLTDTHHPAHNNV